MGRFLPLRSKSDGNNIPVDNDDFIRTDETPIKKKTGVLQKFRKSRSERKDNTTDEDDNIKKEPISKIKTSRFQKIKNSLKQSKSPKPTDGSVATEEASEEGQLSPSTAKAADIVHTDLSAPTEYGSEEETQLSPCTTNDADVHTDLSATTEDSSEEETQLSPFSTKGSVTSGVSPPYHLSFDTIASPSSAITEQSASMEDRFTLPTLGSLGSKSQATKQRIKVLEKPPSAEVAAYSGPPRYDWIDVEAAAATKIQANYRRYTVISKFERIGLVTRSMRNRQKRKKGMQNFFSGGAFSRFCCVDFSLFGEFNGELEKQKQDQKEKYHERKRQQQAKEEELRKYRFNKKESQYVMEEFEVVEEVSVE